MMLTTALAVAAGGAVGALARYGVATWLPTAPGQFPTATLLVNTAGSLLLAVLAALALAGKGPTLTTQALIGTGFCGALTTFSTFSVEAVALVKGGHGGTAALYVALNLVLCFAVTFAAFALLLPERS